MAERRFLLDTSALLSLIEDDAGADRVEELLRGEKILLPWLVLLEVYDLTYRKQGEIQADQRLAMLKQLEMELLMEAGEDVLLTAGRLRAGYPISLSDSIIAGFALQHKAVLVHKDPAFERLNGELRTENLP